MASNARTAAGTTLALVLSLGSIAALVGQLYGVATMQVILLTVTLPSMALLAALGSMHLHGLEGVRERIRVGTVGGVLGVVGYDVFRIPFAIAGIRVFAPIYSYGLLGADAGQSTAWTDALGWIYHLSNGITFGIAYALLFARRSRWIAVGYGVALEAVAFLSPFTDQYGLTGKWWAIGVAFAAHIAYGWPLGIVVERFDDIRASLSRAFVPVTLTVAAPVVLIVLAFRPWSVGDDIRDAGALAAQSGVPTAVITGDSWHPEWLRVKAGACIDLANRTDMAFASDLGAVAANTTTRFCLDDAGVRRVKLDDRPFSGGFVYVED